VEPLWVQREEFDDNRWKDYRKALLTRLEEGAVRGADFSTLVAYAEALKDKELLAACAAQSWKLAKEIPAREHAQVFLMLGLQLQSQLKDYVQGDRALREAIDGPGDKQIKERAKLHRAGLLIHIAGKPQEGLSILKTIKDKDLPPPSEPVLLQIYFADAYAALGNRAEAIRRYESLRTVVPLTDRGYAVGRRGRLLSIGSYIRSGDYESALQELRNIEWETPQERMADDTGILRAQCYIGEKDYQCAVVLLDRLLKVNPDSPRAPEMLLLMIKAYQGMKRNDRAEDTYARMRKEQPYAAETALAAALFSK
jgi:tetratricopeptide (TPR) repeat protein